MDPVTISLLTLGVTAGTAAAGLFGGSSAPKLPAAPPQAPPVQSPTGGGAPKGPAPSFLAAAATPQQQNVSGGKSLLGQ